MELTFTSLHPNCGAVTIQDIPIVLNFSDSNYNPVDLHVWASTNGWFQANGNVYSFYNTTSNQLEYRANIIGSIIIEPGESRVVHIKTGYVGLTGSTVQTWTEDSFQAVDTDRVSYVDMVSQDGGLIIF
jgi:hypothetical protein